MTGPSEPGVVLDTNILVAAGFKPRSASAQIVQLVANGHLRLIWNEQTRRETERVVHQIPPLSKQILDDLFREEHHYPGETHPERFDYVPDAADRKFAALAHAAGKQVVVQSDERGAASILILTPREFMTRR